MYERFSGVSHATRDITYYIGNAQQYATTWQERSTSCNDVIDALPIWFVGRIEHMTEDWDAFLDKTIDPRLPREDLKHHHQSRDGFEGKLLSPTSVDSSGLSHARRHKKDPNVDQDTVRVHHNEAWWFASPLPTIAAAATVAVGRPTKPTAISNKPKLGHRRKSRIVPVP